MLRNVHVDVNQTGVLIRLGRRPVRTVGACYLAWVKCCVKSGVKEMDDTERGGGGLTSWTDGIHCIHAIHPIVIHNHLTLKSITRYLRALYTNKKVA